MSKMINKLRSDFSQKIVESIPDALLTRIFYYFPDPEKDVRYYKNQIRIWWRSVIYLTIKFIVQFFTVLISYSLLFFFLKYLWFVYMNTQVGEIFTSDLSSAAIDFVIQILQQPTFPLVVGMCINISIVTGLLGAFISFSGIRRYFYDARGLVTKIAFSLMVSGLTVYTMESYKDYSQMKSLIALYSIPTFFLIDVIFSLVSKFIPEYKIIFVYKSKIRNSIDVARIRNLN